MIKNLLFLTILLVIGMVFVRWCLSDKVKAIWPNRILFAPLWPVGIGFLSPNLYVFLGLMLFVPLIVARDKRDVAALMLVLCAATPIFRVILGEAGQGLLLVTQSVAAVTAGSLLAFFIKPGLQSRTSVNSNILLAVLFVAILTISESRGLSALTYVRQTLSYMLTILIPIYILSRTVRSKADLEYLAIAVITVTITLAIVGIFEGLRTWPLYQGIVSRLDQVHMMSLTRRVRGGLMRAPGPFAESTSFGFFLGSTMAFAISLKIYASPMRKILAVGAIAAALFLTQSRGAWFGLVIGLIAMLFHMRRSGLAWGLIAASVVGYIGYSLIPTEGSLAEIAGRSGAAMSTSEYRKLLLVRGLEEARRHIFVGQDLATVRLRLEDLRQGEGIIDFVNFYLYLLLTVGLIGLAIFIFISVRSLIQTFPPRSTKGKLRRSLEGHAIFGAMIAALVMSAFTSLTDKNLLWFSIFVGLAGCAAQVYRDDMRQAAKGPRPAG